MREIALCLLLSVSGALAHAEPPVQSRELQILWTGLGYQVGIDNDPPWSGALIELDGQSVYVIESPDAYYPPTVVHLRCYPEETLPLGGDGLMSITAHVALQEARKRLKLPESAFSELMPVVYGELQGYEVVYKDLAQNSEAKLAFVTNRQGQLMTQQAWTLPGKITHAQPALTRVWENIQFVSSVR
ncbi:hypothetical protein [Endozoicomonas acroporae]|uniref:hypothetical protein n=1 Tax=Endozoicomonas acroporae TaxID=1701104 RepID=UPI0013D89E81|nr:hypothetical protein [Endozoicomonas acroporae]